MNYSAVLIPLTFVDFDIFYFIHLRNSYDRHNQTKHGYPFPQEILYGAVHKDS